MQPERMLERGGGRAVEQLCIFRRQKVECRRDGDIEFIARRIHA
jgi:hypothetical protein